MEYHEAIGFLYALRLFGTKLGLENTRALARLFESPHQGLKFIHVAGTNGKGSVCAMLESIYRNAGLKVGLFTSPHLVSFTERIQVNRVCIAESEVSRLTTLLKERLESEQWPFRPTFFEFVTVLALVYFREQRCDLVVWETGLGGRLDATNIVIPLASVITNVQFDHQQWLGNTLEEIAREKAGIIKPGVPVITAATGVALEVIQQTAAMLGAALKLVTNLDLRATDLSLLGLHQQMNAAVALATVDALRHAIDAAPEAIQKGLAQTVWAGRLQKFLIGKTTVLLDGAHNPDGARALAAALDQLHGDRRITLVLGLFKDKAWRAICDALVPKAAEVFLVPIQSERTANPDEIREYCAGRWPRAPIRVLSLREALIEGLRRPFLLVAGSLHLLGETMQELGLSVAQSGERGLNEWDASRSQ